MPSILCIEDEKDLREDVVDQLRETGYETYEASNGLEGLEIIRRVSPDLVLCDITMPKMNGYQLLEELRANYPEHAETPFVFLSALADRKDVISGKHLGADDYLTKPVDFGNLQSTIQARLGQVARMTSLKQQEISDIRTEIMLLLPHELLTPLNHIIGFSEILTQQVFGPIGNEKYLEYINGIHDSGLHLNNTIMNILTLADVVAKKRKPEIHPCKVTSCIEDLFEFHTNQANESGVDFVCDVSPDIPLISGDRALIHQALSALVSNAIKFSAGQGRVDLTATKSNQKGWVQLEVRDHGIGMSTDELNAALEPFSQVNKGMSRQFEGIGMGLTMAKILTESMSGSFAITSAISSGTTATMLLPEWTGECLN